MNERVGIFGGTFDPPHRGHLQVARTACDELGLDRLLWIPAGAPPHKDAEGLTEAHHRVAMTECMVAEDARFELETWEVQRNAVSFTVDTLQHLHSLHPEWTLVLIMGEDQWDAFDAWVQPDVIRDLAEIAVYRRDHARNSDSSDGHAPDHWLSGSLLPEASTSIRERIAQGENPGSDLLDCVSEYVRAQALYR